MWYKKKASTSKYFCLRVQLVKYPGIFEVSFPKEDKLQGGKKARKAKK